MSIFSKKKRDIDRSYRKLGKPSKFIKLRNEHIVKDRANWLIDRNIKNDSLLQKIRLKFCMDSA